MKTNGAESGNILRRIGGRIIRFFSSVRLALILILVITGLCLVGALVIQVPAEFASDAQNYILWLRTVAEPRFGFWTILLSFFQLFNVFHSFLFLAAGTLLIINIFVCSINRWLSQHKSMQKLQAKQDDSFYKSTTGSAEITAPADMFQTANKIHSILKGSHYHLVTENAEDGRYIAGDKNRFCRYGTFVSHLSLILFVIGFFLGSSLGFTDSAFAVIEGTTREVGNGSDLSLMLKSFTDEYWPDGLPKDYRSEVVLYRNGEEVISDTIRVNHPLSYEGIRFYQASFGPAILINVQNSSGEEIYTSAVPLTGVVQVEGLIRRSGSFSLPGEGLSVRLVNPATDARDPALKENEIAIEITKDSSDSVVALEKLAMGVPRQIAGLDFNFIERLKYSTFQVSRDPGNVLIWIASALFVAGLIMSLYFSYVRVWVQVLPQNKKNRISIRLISSRNFVTTSELKNLTEAIKNGHK